MCGFCTAAAIERFSKIEQELDATKEQAKTEAQNVQELKQAVRSLEDKVKEYENQKKEAEKEEMKRSTVKKNSEYAKVGTVSKSNDHMTKKCL